MADVVATAIRGITSTTGSATAYIHVRARSIMDAMVTNSQRITVHPYRVNRGEFMGKFPLVTVLARFYGALSYQEDTPWAAIASDDFSLWDATHASSVWVSDSNSKYGELLSPGGDVVLIPQMHGDRTSTSTYTVAHLQNGWNYNGLIEMSRQSWAIIALRVIDQTMPGYIITGALGDRGLSVQSVANKYHLVLDGTVFATHTKSSNDVSATVIGLSIDNDTISIHIRDRETTAVYSWVTDSELVVNQLILGGPSAPESLVYAAAQGSGTNMPEVMRSMIGYLSC